MSKPYSQLGEKGTDTNQASKEHNESRGNEMNKVEKFSLVPRAKLFKGRYTELTIFWYKLQLRFSRPQTAAWWGNKSLYDFGVGHGEYTEK